MRLNLGVSDVAYAPGSNKNTQTTGDVAEILEKKYNLFSVFYEERQQEIADQLAESLSNELGDVLSGATPSSNPFFDGEQEAIEAFRDFLSMQQMDALGVPGVPTQASLKGVNHRLMHPFSKSNPSRPSFIDTGTLESAFRLWLDRS